MIREQEAVQTVVGDPDSDPREVELLLALGERSLLMVPVVSRGETIGIIEAYRTDERAWSRAEINRARVIAQPVRLGDPDPVSRARPAARRAPRG